MLSGQPETLNVTNSFALDRVVVAISAYKSDEQVLALLQAIFEHRGEEVAQVVVVDSLSDGRLQAEIEERKWPVYYHNAPTNLGSAGNLARRLRMAAESNASWCYALNHDGIYDPALIRSLISEACRESRVGAVFPKRIYTERGWTALAAPTSPYANPRTSEEIHSQDLQAEEIAWDSSNGALYSLAPVRCGIEPWADLWMGWEDLAYSWSLSAAGWRQIRSRVATIKDNYEYESVSLAGKRFYITRKPAWYAYYVIRNLVLFVRRSRGGWRGAVLVVSRLAREMVLTMLYRPQKIARLRLLSLGLAHGLAGRTGKGPVP